MIKISFKRKDCIGCGNCVDVSPIYWKMDEQDGLVVLIGAKKHGKFYVLETGDDALKENQDAEKLCPMRIIKLT